MKILTSRYSKISEILLTSLVRTTMAAATRQILRSNSSQLTNPIFFHSIRFSSTTPSRHWHHNNNEDHEFSKPSKFLGSWEPEKDPKVAEAKLRMLRREYKKQVREIRKEYIYETELQRQEKEWKDEAKREAMRVAKEERKAAKAAMAKVKADERRVFEEEFRQTLMKEKAEKLEYWSLKEKTREEKKVETKELLRRQSSMWIGEEELEKRIESAIVDSTPL